MRQLNKIRAPLFADLIKQHQRCSVPSVDRSIERRPGNPLLRYAVNTLPTDPVPTPPQAN
jgi:hypothetical protein